MKLNNKRLDYWIYNVVYGAKRNDLRSFNDRDYDNSQANSNLPNNLCAYFWLTLLGGVLLLIFGIFILPLYAFRTIREEHGYKNEATPFPMRVILGVGLYYSVVMVYSAVAMWFKSDPGIRTIGIFFYIVLGLVGVAWLISTIKDKMGENRRLKRRAGEKEQPKLIVEFFKAKKQKYCPRIEWTQFKKD